MLWLHEARIPCVLVLLALAVMVTPAQARKRHHELWHCRPGHANTVAADLRAEVFEVPSGSPPRFEGCAYGSTHRYALGPVPYGSSSGSNGSRDYTLLGTSLAFTEGGCPGALAPASAECWETLEVMNLSSGRRLHQVSVRNAQCNGRILGLVLKGDGAVAWIATNVVQGCSVRTQALEVHALDFAGERLLANGTDVAAESLALAGSTVYWMQGGRPYSATLN